jgi:hypothetical protein
MLVKYIKPLYFGQLFCLSEWVSRTIVNYFSEMTGERLLATNRIVRFYNK